MRNERYVCVDCDAKFPDMNDQVYDEIEKRESRILQITRGQLQIGFARMYAGL